MRITRFQATISTLVAVGGLVIAGVQAYNGSRPSAPPEVTVKLELGGGGEAKADMVLAKTDPAAGAPGILQNASYTAAMKDAQDTRYSFAHLFDGRAETFITLASPDTELNVLVDFAAGARKVVSIEYTPPAAGKTALATVLDIMVLPDGQIGSGLPVMTFALQTSPGKQTFSLAGANPGKGLWLRIAGPDGGAPLAIGDFTVVGE